MADPVGMAHQVAKHPRLIDQGKAEGAADHQVLLDLDAKAGGRHRVTSVGHANAT